MSHALLLVPDFLLILCGFVLCRCTALNRSVWDGVERLVYYLLFPVLLFNSILKSPLQPGATLSLGLAGLTVVASGVLLAYALRLLPAPTPVVPGTEPVTPPAVEAELRESLQAIVAALRARGIREINGDLVIDRSRFAKAVHDPQTG